MREMTARSLIWGVILGILFAASSVYLSLKVGLTVSASIPIAVLSITILRALGRATILENNMVQTVGSAGESIAAGVAFTLPSLLLMGQDLEFMRILLVGLLGGMLGVLMMIPLRQGLIVQEHGKLTYPMRRRIDRRRQRRNFGKDCLSWRWCWFRIRVPQLDFAFLERDLGKSLRLLQRGLCCS